MEDKRMDVQGIILAAGLSSRAKSFKMTLKFKGKTVIENTIDNMQDCCSKVFVVGGFQIEKLEPAVEHHDKVELLNNERYLEGMFSSVVMGIEAVCASRFFITPGDYPMISKEVYQELLKYKAPVVIPSFEGRKGHPVLLETEAAKQVISQGSCVSLRDVIKGLETIIVPVDCRGIITDIDTMEDYEILKKQLD
jgi:molybdenum cofactor cytidylyltransferase